ncbi:MAG: hypothetical protein A3K83_00545 [Omnitrophica WOR_2 bacterium RBG_13_44_8b]|nr:MAG: hypothetical protein A3K83_00545 [Omnitrophica WOR_2 bacterium RBG_13_44_8b]
MRLKQFLRNSANISLLLKICVVLILIPGCTSSTSPTYLKEAINEAIQDICKKEYKIDVTVRREGSTLWVYMPLEDMIVTLDKPEKYTETFSIEENAGGFKDGWFNFQYNIKPVPQEEKLQNVSLDKKVMEKINSVLKVLRRVLFSMEKLKKGEPQFICIIAADTKNGLILKNTFYFKDFKKFLYGFISLTEYQHRAIDEVDKTSAVIQDKEGVNLTYHDFGMEEFSSLQILHRIKLKFQRPEVDKNVDIDKEIIKVVTHVIKTYELKDFSAVGINNLLTQNRVTLSRQAILSRPIE